MFPAPRRLKTAAQPTPSRASHCIVTGYGTTEGTHTLVATATDRPETRHGDPVVHGEEPEPLRASSLRWTWAVSVNTIKGGNTVPLKFEVFDGTTELKTTAAVGATFTVAKVTCDTGAPTDAIEVFATTGQTEFRFDTTGDQFIQNWKTPTGSGCYKATMTTVDGQSLTALFKTLK
jgi:hypothetical protein